MPKAPQPGSLAPTMVNWPGQQEGGVHPGLHILLTRVFGWCLACICPGCPSQFQRKNEAGFGFISPIPELWGRAQGLEMRSPQSLGE